MNVSLIGKIKRGIKEVYSATSNNSFPAVVDNPCWGLPSQCSLSDLLRCFEKDKVFVYETDQFLALNKPPDLRMDGHHPSTVLKLLTYWYPPPAFQNLESKGLLEKVSEFENYRNIEGNELRPCHQLDYATSGILLVARNRQAADQARVSFEERSTRKTYLALVHGHLSVPSNIPVMRRTDIDERMGRLEEIYRQSRRKHRKDTYRGYQPAHGLFQQLQQQHSKRAKKEKNRLSDSEWKTVWNELQFTKTETDHILNLSWKEVKASGKTEPFDRAAEVFNKLQYKTLFPEDKSAELSLPTFFRDESEDPNTLFIYASVAQVPHDFAMRINPSMSNASAYLKVGDSSLDYKPSLTRCVILKHAAIRGQPVTKVRLEPRTGRRHQLRVHSALLGHAIVGDQTYKAPGSPDLTDRMCLHSQCLEIPLFEELIKVEAPDPFLVKNREILVQHL